MTEPILTPFLGSTDVTVYQGDCIEVMRQMPENSVDAIVTDPPYGLEFMGRDWDGFGTPLGFQTWTEAWAREAFRVLKPGGHLLAFAGTRTYHRMASGVEDAGFEIRDCIAWMYGSGFPKSLDVSKAIDKHGGARVGWFGPWFREWREANGITQKEVAALFPSKTGGLTGCVANWELGFNMPTPEQFNAIRDKFGLPFESIAKAERDVIGQSAHKPGIGNESKNHYTVGGTIARHVDITAPATDAARKWSGWGTALKPAFEPVVVARKPLVGTVAQNVLEHGTGAINVDGCRIDYASESDKPTQAEWNRMGSSGKAGANGFAGQFSQGMKDAYADGKIPVPIGRWPANVTLDETAAAMLDEQSGVSPSKPQREGIMGGGKGALNMGRGGDSIGIWPADSGGGASRFFYTAKASKKDRNTNGANNTHPTVKPTTLMRWLIRLVTPPGGIILDPFGGSGSTGVAARAEGVRCILIEREAEYLDIIRQRLDEGPLFANLD